MSRKIFRKILACLHPDRGASEKMLNEAFDIFNKLELVLCGEDELPTSVVQMPRDFAEMMAMRMRKAAAKKTKKENQVRKVS